MRNGTRGTVAALDPAADSLTLRTDEGRTVCLPVKFLTFAEHGYASTGHVSQGETVDRTCWRAPGAAGASGRMWPAAVTGST